MNNSFLQKIVVECEQMLNKKVYHDSLISMIGHLQLILEMVIEWNNSVSKMHSIDTTPLIQLLLTWRRMQRKGWTKLLTNRIKLYQQQDVSLFLPFINALSNHTTPIYQISFVINEYISTSTIATFSFRLKIILILA